MIKTNSRALERLLLGTKYSSPENKADGSCSLFLSKQFAKEVQSKILTAFEGNIFS